MHFNFSFMNFTKCLYIYDKIYFTVIWKERQKPARRKTGRKNKKMTHVNRA